MTPMQQWQQLNLAGNSFYILFPAKHMSYRQVIYGRVYVRLK